MARKPLLRAVSGRLVMVWKEEIFQYLKDNRLRKLIRRQLRSRFK